MRIKNKLTSKFFNKLDFPIRFLYSHLPIINRLLFWKLYSSNLESLDREFLKMKSLLPKNFNFSGKKCLELGPGNSRLMAKKIVFEGGRSVVLVDKFPRQKSSHKQQEFEEQENLFLGERFRERKKTKIKFIAGDINSIKISQKFDFIYTTSVLEHLKKPEDVLNSLSKLLSENGLIYHSIDLRDHYNFSEPFLFYKYSSWVWDKLLTREGVSYTNRLRWHDWQRLFDQCGLETISQEICRLEGQKPVDKSFENHGDLNIGIVKVVLKKSPNIQKETLDSDYPKNLAKKIIVDGRAFINEGSSASNYLFNLLFELAKDSFLEIILVLNNERYKNQFHNIGIKIIYSKTKNNFVWDNFLIPFWAIRNKCRIIFYPKSSSCLFRIPGKKIISTIHGMIYKFDRSIPFFVRLYWRSVGKIASVVADKIIAVSVTDRHDLIIEGYSKDKIKVIPIGINRSFFESYPDKEIDLVLNKFKLKRNRYFIHVAKITEKKNQLFSLKVLIDFLRTGNKLIFVGNTQSDKTYYSKVREFIRSNKLNSKVIFSGPIDQNREWRTIPILLSQASIALFPSQYEGFGIPPLEAMAAGTPIIISNRGALKEIYGPDFTLPLEDQEQWIKRFRELMGKSNHRREYLDKQTKLVQKYHWQRIGKEYIKLFRQL